MSLRYHFPPFLTRKGARGVAERVFQRTVRQEALEKVKETAEVTIEGLNETGQLVPGETRIRLARSRSRCGASRLPGGARRANSRYLGVATEETRRQ